MDPKIKPSTVPNLLALDAILQNTTIDSAVRSEDNDLNHNGHPVKGTETVDCPLTTTSSLILPSELIERALLLLDIKSILTCRLVNKDFDEIIRTSILLQYGLARKAASVIDNPRSPLSSAERLETLKRREKAWRTLKPTFLKTIQVDHNQPHYDLSGGTCFLNDRNQKDLHYFHLPSSPQDNPQWKRMKGRGLKDDSPGVFVDFGTAIHEHDLMINAISFPAQNLPLHSLHSLELVLLKFSTAEFHPLARQPRIHVQKQRSAKPTIILKVAGDNLALVVRSEEDVIFDKLFIFDWKSGHKRLEHETIDSSYPDLVFVSPQLLLVPNLYLSHFEVWVIPPSHKSPVHVLCLGLPEISNDFTILDVKCHASSTPCLHSRPYSSRPFFASQKDTLIVINLRLESLFRVASYSIIMHRTALLDTIKKWVSLLFPTQNEDLPIWFTNGVIIHKFADPNDGSVRFSSESLLLSATPHLRNHPSSGVSSSRPLASTSYMSPQVAWADWGPPITRWLKISDTQAKWIMNSAGQRYASLDPNPRDQHKLMLSVMDFNPYTRIYAESVATRRQKGKECDSDNHDEEEGEDSTGDNGNGKRNEVRVEGELEMLDHEGVFSEAVYMGLKCVTYYPTEDYGFDVVLMDDERLLGLKSHGSRVDSITVLHFG